MFIHDSYDRLLMGTVETSSEVSTKAYSDVIDITETGGSDNAELVVTAGSGDQTLTLTVEGCDTEDGEFKAVKTLTTEKSKEFEDRDRLPKFCPRYIRLCAETGETAPSKPVTATIRVAL